MITDEVNFTCYAFNREHGVSSVFVIEKRKCSYSLMVLSNGKGSVKQPKIMLREMVGKRKGCKGKIKGLKDRFRGVEGPRFVGITNCRRLTQGEKLKLFSNIMICRIAMQIVVFIQTSLNSSKIFFLSYSLELTEIQGM
jgi:hypothetical protein